MTLSKIAYRAGRLWGRCTLQHVRRFYDRRCDTFDLRVCGAEHLRAAVHGPCLIVSNHILLDPADTMVSVLLPPKLPGRRLLTHNIRLLLFYSPPDSFTLRRVVREQTGLTLRVVAISNMGNWSRRAVARLLQSEVTHPFANGLRESMGYLPVEHTGRSHRTFLRSVETSVGHGEPVLIFPGAINWEVHWHPRDGLLDGNITPGAAHLAAKYGLAILPAHISGCDSWRTGQAARVAFGPAFHAEGMTKAEVGRQIVARVRGLGGGGPDEEEGTGEREQEDCV